MALLQTPICDFGADFLDFELKDPDGVVYKGAELAGPNGLLVAFICNHCPYVIAIADRLAADAKLAQVQGFGVVAIMSNDYHTYSADNPENMKLFAEKYGFTFPYLVDETQQVGRDYDAVCTPDFFAYNGALKLQYRGRLDDCRPGASADQIANRSPDLLDAMRLIAETGDGPQDQIASAGCSIKWRM
ncbi:MAG: thioredoxin family protein [Rhizobiaceae bacterium]|nr:thioredoxin family protein [Hyphomicrobiales bacterium]NRB30766.1 thioredoxin family protein [Rhizobiaceae bacterium]